MVDLLNLEKTKISKDLSGKIILFYGEYKSGKTTTATRFPQSLLLGFEKGYNALNDIFATPINNWSDYKKALRQLGQEDVQAKFKNIIIDTVDIAWDFCVDFICKKHGVNALSEIAWGKGYKEAEKEFDKALRKIVEMGYGLIMISHDEDKTFTDEEGLEYNKIVPSLDKRPKKIVLRMTDINGYIKNVKDENDQHKVIMFMRGTTRFEAGSRYATIKPYIEFNYENLVNALHEAISEIEKQGGETTEEKINLYKPQEKEDFNSLKERIIKLCETIVGNDKEKYQQVTDLINEHLHGTSLQDSTPKQQEVLEVLEKELLDL